MAAVSNCLCLSSTSPLTSVSRKRRRALFFLMFFRRTDTAMLSTMITTMKRPPITPAAIRGVLKLRHRRGVRGRRKISRWLRRKDMQALKEHETLLTGGQRWRQRGGKRGIGWARVIGWEQKDTGLSCHVLTHTHTHTQQADKLHTLLHLCGWSFEKPSLTLRFYQFSTNIHLETNIRPWSLIKFMAEIKHMEITIRVNSPHHTETVIWNQGAQ